MGISAYYLRVGVFRAMRTRDRLFSLKQRSVDSRMRPSHETGSHTDSSVLTQCGKIGRFRRIGKEPGSRLKRVQGVRVSRARFSVLVGIGTVC